MWFFWYFLGCIIGASILCFLLFTDGNIAVLGKSYHCTRYEIIGKSPDRHEVCAVYERKEGV